MTQSGAQNPFYLVQHWNRVVAPDCVLNASRQVLPGDDQRNLAHRSNDGVGLLQLVRTVAILFEHLLQTAHLAFDATQTM